VVLKGWENLEEGGVEEGRELLVAAAVGADENL
jgi:hypothetical protein